jgi:hypothetical protein
MTYHDTLLVCELCGVTDRDVRAGLACYADDGRFERVDRCSDHQACRGRVEAFGRPWPLIDITDRVPA